MSLLLLPVMVVFALILVALAIYTVPIAIATSLAIVAAAVAWRYWPTTSYWGVIRKLLILSIMVLVVDGIVVSYCIKIMLRDDSAPTCEALGEQIRLVMNDAARIDRFQKAMTLGATARSVQCQGERQAEALARIGSSDANEEFSSTDIEVAWQYFTQINSHPDLCDSSIYVALQLRRMGIDGVLETIQSFPKNQFWCNSREAYISQVRQRCTNVWQDRCKIELPRESLQQMINNPKMGPMGSELPDLIKDVWGDASVTR